MLYREPERGDAIGMRRIAKKTEISCRLHSRERDRSSLSFCGDIRIDQGGFLKVDEKEIIQNDGCGCTNSDGAGSGN